MRSYLNIFVKVDNLAVLALKNRHIGHLDNSKLNY